MKRIIVIMFSILVGFFFGILYMVRRIEKKLKILQELNDKHLALYSFMTKWVQIKQEGRGLSEYFVNSGYYRIAIYGMNFVGVTLLNELKNTDIKVVYGIDRNAENMDLDIRVVTPDEELDEADVIVVTPITYFDSIKKTLKNKNVCPIVSIEDVLYEC